MKRDTRTVTIEYSKVTEGIFDWLIEAVVERLIEDYGKGDQE